MSNSRKDLMNELFNNLSDDDMKDILDLLGSLSITEDKKEKNQEKPQFGINSFLKSLDDEIEENQNKVQVTENKESYVPVSERTTDDIVAAYLTKRGYVDIDTSIEFADFICTDPSDTMLGDETSCKVLGIVVETESEEESEEFTVNEILIKEVRKILLNYMARFCPETTDGRVDIVLVSRDNKYRKYGAVSIMHEMGVARLLLLSKEV